MKETKKAPSIKKNFIYTTVYQILVLIVPLVSTPYVSRVLGADGVGTYSYTSSVMTFFMMFAALGTQSYATREVAQNREDKKRISRIFWEIEVMVFLTTAFCLFVWILFCFISAENRWYFFALTPMLIGIPLDISWLFNGYEYVKYVVLRNSICKIAGVVLLFLFVKEKNDLLLYFWINSLSILLGNLSMWTYLPRLIEKVDLHGMSVMKHLKETIVYFIPTIATSVYTLLDKTLIGLITKDSYENGFYEQATKIINIIKVFVFSALNSVVGVRTSYLFAQNKVEEIKGHISRSLDIILFLGYGAMFGLIGVVQNFVPVFFGDGYEPVISLLIYMAPMPVIIGISNCLGSQYYSPSGQRKLSAKFIMIGAVINLILNLFLIPNAGAVGATIASVIAEVLITIMYVRYCQGCITVCAIWMCSYKRIISGSIMLVSIYMLGQALGHGMLFELLLQVVVGVMIYFVILLIMKDRFLYDAMNKILGFLKKKFVK